MCIICHPAAMAEWLRRLIRNQMGSSRVGSNPTRSVYCFLNYLKTLCEKIIVLQSTLPLVMSLWSYLSNSLAGFKPKCSQATSRPLCGSSYRPNCKTLTNRKNRYLFILQIPFKIYIHMYTIRKHFFWHTLLEILSCFKSACVNTAEDWIEHLRISTNKLVFFAWGFVVSFFYKISPIAGNFALWFFQFTCKENKWWTYN